MSSTLRRSLAIGAIVGVACTSVIIGQGASVALPPPPTPGANCPSKGELVPGFLCAQRGAATIWIKAASAPKAGARCSLKGASVTGLVCKVKKGALAWVASSSSGSSPGGSSGGSTSGTPAAQTPAAPSSSSAAGVWTATASNSLYTSGSLPVGTSYSGTSGSSGTVFVCRTQGGMDGASSSNVPWISGGVWYPGQKVAVTGSNSKPGSVSIAVSGARRVISGNGLPSTSSVGNFPITSSQPAYAYDRNPNSVLPYGLSVSVPASPAIAGSPGCLGGGAIGYTTNGVAIFNALDAANRDAAAYETLDGCFGHPQKDGVYHFHTISACVGAGSATENSAVFGFMLDGFPITGPWEGGRKLTNADLDMCHGKTSEITVDGARVTMYHYVATEEFPYTASCYRGSK